MHLLIAFASCDDPACRQVLRELRLPQLQRLLTRLSPQTADAGPDAGLHLPHERIHARALGLDPQAPAWAALRAHELALPDAGAAAWAFITPCHWQVGQGQVSLLPPQELDLGREESRALLDAMQPYFEEDGIALIPDSPARWLAKGEVFRHLASASPQRVLRRDIGPWLPASPLLQRLQNEMQMLLYTHAVNDARAQRAALPVNSFWISGSGALSTPPAPPTRPLTLVEDLAHAAGRGDWLAWGQAWEQIDAAELAALLQQLDAGAHDLTLTLCGEQHARSFSSAPRGLWSRATQLFRQPSLPDILDSL